MSSGARLGFGTAVVAMFLGVIAAGNTEAGAQAPPTSGGETKPAPRPPATALSPEDAAKLARFVDPESLTVIGDGFVFTEGPLWMGDRLLVCDLGAGSMWTLTPAPEAAGAGGKSVVYKKEEFRAKADRPAGAALDPKGRLVVTHFTGKVTRTERDGTTITTIAERWRAGESGGAAGGGSEAAGAEKALSKCNDLAIRRDGVIYFTDFGGGREGSRGVFMIAATGESEGRVRLLDDTVAVANGVALSPDEKTLYVAEFAAGRIKAYTLAADGSVADGRTFADLSSEKSAGKIDGLKTDAEGKVWTTGPGGIWILSAGGETLARWPLPQAASNLGFGGADGRTVFITAGKNVFAARRAK